MTINTPLAKRWGYQIVQVDARTEKLTNNNGQTGYVPCTEQVRYLSVWRPDGFSDNPIRYVNGHVVYDQPEALPKWIKSKVKQLMNQRPRLGYGY